MDNHPIPQDITGFQFKLIGNMTIKQFAYMAAGAVFAWLIYNSPLFFLIKIPLAFIFVGAGISLAFLPVGGRPLDVMLNNFVHAMFNPTQFIYEKRGGHLYEERKRHTKETAKQTAATPAPAISAYIRTASKPKNAMDEKEMVYFSNLASIYKNQQPLKAFTPLSTPHAFDKMPVEKPKEENIKINPTVSAAPENKDRRVFEKEVELGRELIVAKQREAALKNPVDAAKAHQDTLALEEELRQAVAQKTKLEQQLVSLNRKLEAQKQTVYSPSVGKPDAPPVPAPQTAKVRTISQSMGKSVGLPIAPDSPNVVSGIVKDPRGNPLPNILVEVKDSEGVPVRAFKTNGVGQFASATALMNGVYTIEFEDPKEENRFDVIRFEAKGEIILPVEVISTDKREELRRELFN